MIDKPLLTIAIPTYNRATYLELNLKRLHEEIAGLSEHFRSLIVVHISDNASTDETLLVIERHRHMMAHSVRTIFNEINIGPDANIEQCYKSATTPYVWIIGDDDVILENTLHLIIEKIAKQDIDILFLGSYGYDKHYLDRPKTRLRKHGFLIFDNPLEFTRRTNIMLTFISVSIVRSGIPTTMYREILEGSSLSQLGWIFSLLCDGKRFAILKDYVIAAKKNNSSGYGLAQVFGINLQKIADHILKNRPELIKTIQNGTILHFFPSAFMREFRIQSKKFNEENISQKLIQVFGGNWRYHVFLVPLNMLPMVLARLYVVFISIVLRFFRHWLI